MQVAAFPWTDLWPERCFTAKLKYRNFEVSYEAGSLNVQAVEFDRTLAKEHRARC